MDQSKTESTDFEEGEQAEVEGEDDDEEEDDDIEPKLNYNRVDNDVGNVFKTDSITCLTLYDRVCFCFGSKSLIWFSYLNLVLVFRCWNPKWTNLYL